MPLTSIMQFSVHVMKLPTSICFEWFAHKNSIEFPVFFSHRHIYVFVFTTYNDVFMNIIMYCVLQAVQ